MVGRGRVELPTSRLSGVRSNHLSYRPLRPSPALLAREPVAKVFAGAAPFGADIGEKRKRNEDGVVPHVLGSPARNRVPIFQEISIERSIGPLPFLRSAKGAIGALKKSSLERR